MASKIAQSLSTSVPAFLGMEPDPYRARVVPPNGCFTDFTVMYMEIPIQIDDFRIFYIGTSLTFAFAKCCEG